MPGEGTRGLPQPHKHVRSMAPPGVVVTHLSAAWVDHRGEAVLAAGVQEHPAHRVVAEAAAPEVEICRSEGSSVGG